MVGSAIGTMVQSTDEGDLEAVMTGSNDAIVDNSISEEQKKTLKTKSSESAKETADIKGYDTEKTSEVIKNAGFSTNRFILRLINSLAILKWFSVFTEIIAASM